MITREKALEILDKNLINKNMFRHELAVEAAMKDLAKRFNGDEIKWGLVGLLHDGDYEKTKDDAKQHGVLMAKWLTEAGETDQEISQAILSHNYAENGSAAPNTPLEWSLYCCDELTGFIVAVALVMPGKKLADVTTESVLKKFPSKQFAAGVNRDQIKLCEEKLKIPLQDFVGIVLSSMQNISSELGL